MTMPSFCGNPLGLGFRTTLGPLREDFFHWCRCHRARGLFFHTSVRALPGLGLRALVWGEQLDSRAGCLELRYFHLCIFWMEKRESWLLAFIGRHIPLSETPLHVP